MNGSKNRPRRGVIIAATALGVGALGLLAGCGTTVRPGQVGLKYIVLEEPALELEARPEGFYFQWPWNGMVVYDVTAQSRDEEVWVLSQDDLHVVTTVTVTYRARKDEIHRLHTEIGPDYYEEVVGPAFVTLVRTEFARHKHNDLAKDGSAIEASVTKQLSAILADQPIEIQQVAIKHIQYDRMVTESISRKLAREQQAEEKQHEMVISLRNAEIARNDAKGSADAIKIVAGGEAEAIVLRANAQAKAQEAIGKTLTQPYLQYKAFDGQNTRYYFVPVGKDGLPVIIDAGSGGSSGPSPVRD